jgi:hypothetical protein
MQIKLIAPHEQSEDNISSAQTFKIQKVNLPLLAALTPPDHSVKIVDEAFAPDDKGNENLRRRSFSNRSPIILSGLATGHSCQQTPINFSIDKIRA